jgi:hypothetical protein
MELSYLQIVAIVIISIAAGGIFTLFIVLALNKSMGKPETVSLPKLQSDIAEYVNTRKVEKPPQIDNPLAEEWFASITKDEKPVKRENIENVRKQEIIKDKKRKSVWQQMKEAQSSFKPKDKVKPEKSDGNSLKAF